MSRTTQRPSRAPHAAPVAVRFQPVRDIRSRHIVALHATIARPTDPQPVASPPVDLLARAVCRQIHAWWTADPNHLIPPVTIALGAGDCADVTAITRLLEVPAQHHLPGGCLSFSVPEAALDRVLTDDVVASVTASGSSLQVHRFGAGTVSLVQLRDATIGTLRLDSALVAGLPRDDACVDVVRGAIALGGALGKRIVAVDVVRQDQLDCLTALGCTEIQGSLAGLPRRADAMAQLFMTRGEAMTSSSAAAGSSLDTVARVTAEISRHELELGIDHLRSLVDR